MLGAAPIFRVAWVPLREEQPAAWRDNAAKAPITQPATNSAQSTEDRALAAVTGNDAEASIGAGVDGALMTAIVSKLGRAVVGAQSTRL